MLDCFFEILPFACAGSLLSFTFFGLLYLFKERDMD